MVNKTGIEYLTHTWNPIAMRCTPVSEGCLNCWHLRMADRLAANPKLSDEKRAAYAVGRLVMDPAERLNIVIKRKRPAVIGVQFMGDLFHGSVSFEQIDQIFARMAAAPWHTFVILTKRPHRMHEYIAEGEPGIFPYPSVWLGVTVENQEQADIRIPILLQIPAAVRFVSVEPMLGPVDIDRYLGRMQLWWQSQIAYAELAHQHPNCEIPKLDWVICGGETGPGARPMQGDWARSIREQCNDARVPFFFKQHGDWWCKEFRTNPKHRENGEIDGLVWDQMPKRGVDND